MARKKIGKKNQRHREMMLVAKRSKAWGWTVFAAMVPAERNLCRTVKGPATGRPAEPRATGVTLPVIRKRRLRTSLSLQVSRMVPVFQATGEPAESCFVKSRTCLGTVTNWSMLGPANA
jgi:hypothetical protein